MAYRIYFLIYAPTWILPILSFTKVPLYLDVISMFNFVPRLRCISEFRTLGLRHMVVINSNHNVVGIITRKDITNKTLRAHWEAQVIILMKSRITFVGRANGKVCQY